MLASSESHYIISNALLNSKLIKKVDSQLNFHGISFTEFMIMYQLSQAPNKTMRRIELAESVGISASGITRLIAPMEKIKLVNKVANPRDARQSLVELSQVGETLFKESSVSFDFCAKSLVQRLSSNQLEKLTELTEKMM